MKALGIDIGSAWTKAVLLEGGEIVAAKAIPTGPDFAKAGLRAARSLLRGRGGLKGVKGLVVTGYGRDAFPRGRKVTELTCQARGVWGLRPSVRTIIDVGGQDTKVIRIGEEGRLLTFVMNDKCAAGTGRFLEAIARALRMRVWELGLLAEQAELGCSINSTCTVFAETEVIGLLASGRAKEDVCRGVIESVGKRVAALALSLGVEGEVALVGGVAKVPCLKEALEEELGTDLVDLPLDPQFTGAYGAALLAADGRSWP